MKKHAINKLIEFYGLSKFKNNAEQDLFSVYFYETDTAILCHSGIFFDASIRKATKEQYMKNLSDAFKIIPVGAANIFKESLGLTALHNCKANYEKETEFEISNQSGNIKNSALLKAHIDENNNVSIEGVYSPIPAPLNFNSIGQYVPSNNSSDQPANEI